MSALYELFALSHLYIAAGMGYVRETPALPAHYVYPYDQNRIANPLGIFAVGYEWEPTRTITIDAGYRHQSFIPVDDIGQDQFQLTVTWRPFK